MSKYEKFSKVPKAVQVRYFRIRFSKYVMFAVRSYMRMVLVIVERKKSKELASAIYTFKKETARARGKSNDCVQKLMNIGLYLKK